jgi:serine/threonine protein kinase
MVNAVNRRAARGTRSDDRRSRERTTHVRGRRYDVLEVVELRGRRYDVIERHPRCAVAVDERLGRKVVLRFRPHGDRRHTEREARVLVDAATHSRTAPRVLDRGRTDDEEFLVVEWQDGRLLGELIAQGQREKRPYFAPHRCGQMLLTLALGLRDLHRHHILHLDLKPDNLLVVHGPALRMIDFGIAWNATSVAREGLGSPGFAAPEQWKRAPHIDERADQFSASCVAYVMLTNQLPYHKLGSRIVDVGDSGGIELVPARSLNPRVEPELDRVIAKGLALERKQRFETTEQWVAALRAASPDRGPDEAGFLREATSLIVQDVRSLFRRVMRGRGSS